MGKIRTFRYFRPLEHDRMNFHPEEPLRYDRFEFKALDRFRGDLELLVIPVESLHRISEILSELGLNDSREVFVGAVNEDGSRVYLNKGQGRKYFAKRYSNALYSDDGGMTWTPSQPFSLLGSSEPGLLEVKGGRIYYNARTHVREGNKLVGQSLDGGESWVEAKEDDELFDGPPDVYGCKGALAKFQYNGQEVLLFSAPGQRDKRDDITIRASLDGGETWPVSRLVKEGPGNYTWLAVGRKGTPSEGFIYLLSNKDWMARFNFAWVMEPGTQVER